MPHIMQGEQLIVLTRGVDKLSTPSGMQRGSLNYCPRDHNDHY